jgi:hypothetical protein
MSVWRSARLALPIILAAAVAGAHKIPVCNSTCAFEPVEIDAPDGGISVRAVPAASSDQFVIKYDPQAGIAQFDMSALPPRSFTVGGVNATLALPTLFNMQMTTIGDLIASVPVTITLGGASASEAMTLTTGLAIAGTMILEGSPIPPKANTSPPPQCPDPADQSITGFTLVGVVPESGLGAPLAGRLGVRLSCQATPAPDRDQFTLATQTTLVTARLSAQLLKVRAIFAPGASETADFPNQRALVRVHAGDSLIAVANLPTGLATKGKKAFIGKSADGTVAIGVVVLRKNPLTYFFEIKLQNPTLPAAGAGPLDVTVTYEVGGLLSRVEANLRPNRRATKFHFP